MKIFVMDSLSIVKDDSKAGKKNLTKMINIITYNKTKDTSEKHPFLFHSNLLNQSLMVMNDCNYSRLDLINICVFLKTTDFLCYY